MDKVRVSLLYYIYNNNRGKMFPSLTLEEFIDVKSAKCERRSITDMTNLTNVT